MPSLRRTKQQIMDELALANQRIETLESRLNQNQNLKNNLTTSEQRYKTVIEAQSDLICRLLPGGTISFVNPAYCRFYGRTETDLIGKNFLTDHVPAEDHQLLKDHFKAFSVDHPQRTVDQRAKGPGGQIHWIQWIDNAIFDVNGKIIEFQCVGRDITTIKAVTEALHASQAELLEQKKSLEQKNSALAEILEQIGIEKEKIKDNVRANVQEVILPVMDKIRLEQGSHRDRYIDLLQSNLVNLVSAFGRKVSDARINLTPRELEICNLIKNGLTGKEAAELLHISYKTIEVHRQNIRRKFKINNEKINLATYLQELH